jgi:hypothetical protein
MRLRYSVAGWCQHGLAVITSILLSVEHCHAGSEHCQCGASPAKEDLWSHRCLLQTVSNWVEPLDKYYNQLQQVGHAPGYVVLTVHTHLIEMLWVVGDPSHLHSLLISPGHPGTARLLVTPLCKAPELSCHVMCPTCVPPACMTAAL